MEEKNETELQYLNHYYEKEGNQLVVLYAQKNMEMTELVRYFCSDKPYSLYRARPCSEREQLYLWGNELKEEGASLSVYPAFSELFGAMTAKRAKKRVIIIEEFHHIIKQSQDFMEQLVGFMHNAWNSQQVMVLLCSTSIGWVENSMIRKIGEAAYAISGFIKVKEKSFFDMVRRFPENTRWQQVEIYAVMGGFPGLWKHFEEGLSVRENICRYILQKDCFLHEEALRLVADELRETNVYHSILTALASGKQKLNDLYLHTGFSRAKISVYLKNLMELEIVEKVFSYDTAGRENAQKGIYRIRNHFVQFYFRYLYPHMSRLDAMAPELFYDTYIAPDFRSFTAPAFGQVCREYIEYLNIRGQLPFTYTKAGEWVGKVGDIDIVAQDDNGNTIIGFCNWEEPVLQYEDYEWLLFCARKAKLAADYVYLFSASGFDRELIQEAEAGTGLQLIDLEMF